MAAGQKPGQDGRGGLAGDREKPPNVGLCGHVASEAIDGAAARR
jgi:hypothetical protein